MATTEQLPPPRPRAGRADRRGALRRADRRLHEPVRLDDLLYEAAERVPGLVPTRAEMEAERARKLADKQGLELSQGLLLAESSRPRAPAATWSSRCSSRPPLALERLDELRSDRHGRPRPRARHPPRPRRRARAAQPAPPQRRGRHTLGRDRGRRRPDPARSRDRGRGVPRRRRRPPALRRRARRSAPGINLTHLYHGRIDFLFYLVRDLGYVNKIYRGLARTGRHREAVDRGGRAVRDRRRLPARCT